MMERAAFAVLLSCGFDGEGNHEPPLDEWLTEDCGWINSDCINDFVNARYPKAIRVIRLTPEQIERLEKKYEIKFDPEAGCHPLK